MIVDLSYRTVCVVGSQCMLLIYCLTNLEDMRIPKLHSLNISYGSYYYSFHFQCNCFGVYCHCVVWPVCRPRSRPGLKHKLAYGLTNTGLLRTRRSFSVTDIFTAIHSISEQEKCFFIEAVCICIRLSFWFL